MPNLAGVWSPSLGTDELRTLLGAQLERIDLPGFQFDRYTHLGPGLAVGYLDPGILENGAQPARTDDGLALFLDGEIHNLRELRIKYRLGAETEALSSVRLCLQLLVGRGIGIVGEFNGLFALVLHDARAGRLQLVTDRFASRSIFTARRMGGLLFGSELKALAAIDPEPKRPDPAGILEMFAFGSHVHGKTWLSDYQHLPPATVLTADRDGIRTETYGRYRYQEDAPTLDQPEYFTRFAVLLDRAVERRMQSNRRIGIFLSGGYDSRSVAASIRKHHLPIPAFTFGLENSRDMRYAAMLAQRLGLEHHPVTDEGPYLEKYCRAILWRTEGLVRFSNTTSIRHHPLIKSRMDIILTGFLGEFSGSHTWPELLAARSRKGAVDAIFKRHTAHRMSRVHRLFTPTFLRDALPEMRARFDSSFENIANEHPLNLADAWNFSAMQPRITAQAPTVDRHLLEMRAPHTDGELVEFLLTIPPMQRLEQRVYKQTIAYAFPEIRDVPCTNSGLPIDPHFYREYLKMAARYGARKSIGLLRRSIGRQEPLGRKPRNLADDLRREPGLIENILKPLLDREILPPSIFDYAGIQSLIDEHYSAAADHEEAISLLISLGVAMEFFLFDDLSRRPAEYPG